MIAPALPAISAQFNITSSVLESLMLSVFILAYAVGPLFLAPLSEMFGRRIVLQSANLFFIVFTVACAVAQNRVQLSIFRFFAGLGGSAPLTIGGGTVSDLMLPEERGVAMSIYSLGPLMGPALGPIIGGWIIQRTGNWRWIFGVASIAAGVTAAIGIFILPETYAPKILGKKAARLRKETGNEKLHTVFDQNAMTWQSRMRHNMVRPFILISTQPIIIVLGVYLMIIYGCIYLVLTTFSSVFEQVYGESVGIASLNYLSLALGFTLGGQICGRLNDYNYKRLKATNNGVGKPEYKLPVMMATGWMPAAGLIIYGWSAQYAVHWIVPNIGAAILAFGMIATFQCIQTYTVDTYTLYAASALSANTFLRSLAGFALPLASGRLYDSLGYGWGNTVLGLIAAIVGIPAPFLLFNFGERIRAKSQYCSG
jgi:multidrug resistance protein